MSGACIDRPAEPTAVIRFGRRLWIVPSAGLPPDDADAVVVHLDPGPAFGTGAHPSTALCLQVLESLSLTGRRVIDYGCGSGILAIAALKLGAAQAQAIDIDATALAVTRANAVLNRVAELIVTQEAAVAVQPAHYVLANILLAPLVELAPTLTAACEPTGWLVLSGILRTQVHEVKAVYAPYVERARIVTRGEWCCYYAQKYTEEPRTHAGAD